MILVGALAEEGMHHLQHGHGDQCLQQRWDQLMWSPHQQKHQKSAKPLIPPLLFPSLLLVPNSTIMLSTGLRSRSQSQDCQGFQALSHLSGLSMQMASRATTHSFTARRTPTRSHEYHQIGSGGISSEAITPAFYMIKGAFSLICALTMKPLLDCRA